MLLSMGTIKVNNRGFTMTEIVVSIIILGFLVSMALPRYTFVVEKMKSGEALEILDALKNAQIRYKYETGVFASDINDLDVGGLDTPSQFNAPLVAIADPIALIQRNDPNTYDYILGINEDGTITCDINGSPPDTCTKLGL